MGESLTSASVVHYAKSINYASSILCESMQPIVTQQSVWHRTLHFPFTARCVTKRAISPLEPGEKVKVVEMATVHEFLKIFRSFVRDILSSLSYR